VEKYISIPSSPPRLEGPTQEKAKELHEVSDGDEAVVIEGTSDGEDEETL
jgi:hypothetical protein